MARKLKPAMEEQVPVNASNSKAIILEAANDVDRFESQISEIREKIKQAKAPVKGIISMKAFNDARRIRSLEPDDRDTYLDERRLAFEALGLGEQGSLFPDGEDADDEMTPTQARAAGRRAGRAGKSALENPFAERHALNPTWNEGWLDGQRAIAEGMAPKGGNGAEGTAVQ